MLVVLCIHAVGILSCLTSNLCYILFEELYNTINVVLGSQAILMYVSICFYALVLHKHIAIDTFIYMFSLVLFSNICLLPETDTGILGVIVLRYATGLYKLTLYTCVLILFFAVIFALCRSEKTSNIKSSAVSQQPTATQQTLNLNKQRIKKTNIQNNVVYNFYKTRPTYSKSNHQTETSEHWKNDVYKYELELQNRSHMLDQKELVLEQKALLLQQKENQLMSKPTNVNIKNTHITNQHLHAPKESPIYAHIKEDIQHKYTSLNANKEDVSHCFAAPPEKINMLEYQNVAKDTQSNVNDSIESNMSVLPSLDLLKHMKHNVDNEEDLDNMSMILTRVLEEFSIKGEFVGYKKGPVITLFEFKPAPGVISARIISLSKDIARAASVISIRISTIVGYNLIGFEVPNHSRVVITIRSILESNAYLSSSARLPLALGCNIIGDAIIVDLASMPHLLIAGTTGSGKSVALHALIVSLLYKHTKDTCKLLLIDPKMLEFSLYSDLPHLLFPIITQPKEAIAGLKWATNEMTRRYQLLKDMEVRNIESYNEKVQYLNKMHDSTLESLPYIVIVIDELADLMITSKQDVESLIQRLAQMARASGIHMILATQRPSTEVCTGPIKANFPTRISFKLPTMIDSRTILGDGGRANELLGKGDMLFLENGILHRLQAPFISEAEILKVVKNCQEQGPPEYISLVTDTYEELNSEDDLYEQAKNILYRDKQISISYLQRRLSIGYNKAASLIEMMEEDNLISSPNKQGKRLLIE